MTFLAPWALWAAGAVSAVVIALHILASKNPRVTALPTTRFVPDVPLRATARAIRLTDVLLLLLRVAAGMLVGLAFARPELTTGRRSVGRVVMVDQSAFVRDPKQAVDSASRYAEKGDLLFAFDSAVASQRSVNELISAQAHRSSPPGSGSLSAALAAAMRAASRLRGDADSVELVLVSPLAAQEWDHATGAIRAAWPGRVRLVRVAGIDSSVTPVSIDVRNAPLDDPIRAAVALLPHGDTTERRARRVVLDRGSPASVDSSWATLGNTLVLWPASLDSSGWRTRGKSDTAGAVIAKGDESDAVVVSTFVRAIDPAPGRVVAQWADGAPAATERAEGDGCIREVAIPVARSGDLALRESTRRLVAALASPCGDVRKYTPASDSALARLGGTGPLVAARALETHTAPRGHLASWLLATALALLLLEPLLRRQRASA